MLFCLGKDQKYYRRKISSKLSELNVKHIPLMVKKFRNRLVHFACLPAKLHSTRASSMRMEISLIISKMESSVTFSWKREKNLSRKTGKHVNAATFSRFSLKDRMEEKILVPVL